jgi:stress response protein YsnF
LLPEKVVDDDLRRREFRSIVRGDEAATHLHRDLQRREVAARDVVDQQQRRLAVPVQRDAALSDREDILEARRVALDLAELLIRERAEAVRRRLDG